MWRKIVNFLLIFGASAVTFKDGGYEDLVVGVSEKVKQPESCFEFLLKLEESFRDASFKLHIATNSRASFRKITVILPRSWKCERTVRPTSDVSWMSANFKITERDQIVTQQPRQCGKYGESTLLPVQLFKEDGHSNLGEILVREWAKLRYGIYDQTGYPDDPVYQSEQPKCSQDRIDELLSQCDGYYRNCSTLPLLLRVGFEPCQAESEKPTKHQVLCGRRSASELIFSHSDLRNSLPVGLSNLTFDYVTQSQPRFVLALDSSAEMNQKDNWKFMRTASRRFILQDLPMGMELAVLTFSSTVRTITGTMVTLSSDKTRESIVAKIPDYPDKAAAKCLECAVKEAIKLLEKDGGSAAGNVLLLVTSGTTNINEINIATNLAKQKKLKISVISYTRSFQYQEFITYETGGALFSVPTSGPSNLATLISLGDALLATLRFHLDGTPDAANVPQLVHKSEFKDTTTDPIVNGTFFLDPSLGRDTLFALYFSSRDNPNIKNLWLTSPDGTVYEGRAEDSMSALYFSTLYNIEAPGLWKYAFEREPQTLQSHFVKVTSRAKPTNQESVTARLLSFGDRVTLNATSEPVILYVQVTFGNMPVTDARVTVNVRYNGIQGMEIPLYDNGSGDPDITAGDGIYSRYFIPPVSAATQYFLTITVDHNDGRAYTTRPAAQASSNGQPKEITTCCGSHVFVSVEQRDYLPPFSRISFAPLLTIVDAPPTTRDVIPPNRIGDLRVVVNPENELVNLFWTAVGDDFDHGTASSYELRYSSQLDELFDRELFETLPSMSVPQLPRSVGTPSNFSFHFSNYDTTYYFVLRASDESDNYGELSNYISVFIPSPPTVEPVQPVTPRFISLAPPPAQKLGIAAIAGIAAGGCVALLLMLLVACCVVLKNRKAKSKYNQNKTLNEVSIYTEEKKPGVQPEKLLVVSQVPERPQQPVHWTATQLLQEHERRNSLARNLDHFQNLEPHYGVNQVQTGYNHYPIPSERYDCGGGSSPNSYNSNHSDGPMLPPPYESSGEYSAKLPPPTLPKPALRAISYANPSLQGSFASLASEKKRRNITQV